MWVFIFIGKLRTLKERVPPEASPEADSTDEFSVHDTSNCFTGILLGGRKKRKKAQASL